MRYLTFSLMIFSLIFSITICASHVAHASVDTSSEISMPIDIDNSIDGDACDMACGGCCIHHAMDATNNVKEIVSLKAKAISTYPSVFVSQNTNGLKRPPKS
jgi:hypothetical protein